MGVHECERELNTYIYYRRFFSSHVDVSINIDRTELTLVEYWRAGHFTLIFTISVFQHQVLRIIEWSLYACAARARVAAAASFDAPFHYFSSSDGAEN